MKRDKLERVFEISTQQADKHKDYRTRINHHCLYQSKEFSANCRQVCMLYQHSKQKSNNHAVCKVL